MPINGQISGEKCSDQFSELWAKVTLILLAFPSTYNVEQGFSEVLYIKKKQYRNRLDMNKTGGHTIRFKLTTLHPAFASLAEKH